MLHYYSLVSFIHRSVRAVFLPEQALDSKPGWQSLEEKWVSGEWVSIMAPPLSPSTLS
jgi:hypothetical protein